MYLTIFTTSSGLLKGVHHGVIIHYHGTRHLASGTQATCHFDEDIFLAMTYRLAHDKIVRMNSITICQTVLVFTINGLSVLPHFGITKMCDSVLRNRRYSSGLDRVVYGTRFLERDGLQGELSYDLYCELEQVAATRRCNGAGRGWYGLFRGAAPLLCFAGFRERDRQVLRGE